LRKASCILGILAVLACLLPRASADAKGDDLILAATIGDLHRVEKLLAKGADVNTKANNGGTALMWASQNGHLDVVQVLLAKGADVNAKANNGETALMPASQYGHLDVVLALLAKGADVNANSGNGWTALRLASQEGNLDVAKALLAKGADVNATDDNGLTALMDASRSGHLDVIKALIAKGADVNARGVNHGWTALMEASLSGHLDVVQVLLAEGASVNAKASNGATALGAASAKCHTDVVQALLAKGADKSAASLTQQCGPTTGANQGSMRPDHPVAPPVYWLDPAGGIHSVGVTAVEGGHHGAIDQLFGGDQYKVGNQAFPLAGLFAHEAKINKFKVSVYWREMPLLNQVTVQTQRGYFTGPTMILVAGRNCKFESTKDGDFLALVIGASEWLLPDFDFGSNVYNGRIVPYK